MKFLKYHLPLIAYACLIFALSSISYLHQPLPRLTWGDKVAHLIEFSIFGLLLWRSGSRWGIKLSKLSILLLIILIGVVFAASDELHQYFVPGRDCHILDWTADTVGLAAGAIIAYIFSERKEKPKPGVKGQSS
jgi:VanZ family protein